MADGLCDDDGNMEPCRRGIPFVRFEREIRQAVDDAIEAMKIPYLVPSLEEKYMHWVFTSEAFLKMEDIFKSMPHRFTFSEPVEIIGMHDAFNPRGPNREQRRKQERMK